MIGQRLYTGRVAVAQAALEYSKTLFDVTKQYSVVWISSPPLRYCIHLCIARDTVDMGGGPAYCYQ
jgi:hypothetical protein